MTPPNFDQAPKKEIKSEEWRSIQDLAEIISAASLRAGIWAKHKKGYGYQTLVSELSSVMKELREIYQEGVDWKKAEGVRAGKSNFVHSQDMQTEASNRLVDIICDRKKASKIKNNSNSEEKFLSWKEEAKRGIKGGSS